MTDDIGLGSIEAGLAKKIILYVDVIKGDFNMKVELCKGLEVESITIRRDNKKQKSLIVHTNDGRHIDLGFTGITFGQHSFMTVMLENGITMTKRPIMQWDAFTISLMQKAKHGGGN